MKKDTIVYVGGFEMPDKNAAAHRVLNNSKIFRELGYHVVFCGINRLVDSNVKTPLLFDGFESYPMKYPKTKKEWMMFLLSFDHIKYVLESYDNIKFVVAYNLHAIPLNNLIKFCKRRNIALIVDATEWYQNKFSLIPDKLIKWLDTQIVMRKLQKKADGLISISSYLYNYYSKAVKNIVQLPPMVDVKEEVWTQKIEVDKKIRFIYVGNPGKDKDKLNTIVSAYGETSHKNCIFDIVGLTKQQFIEDYSNSLSILDESIVFHGKVSHRESIRLLRQADYSVFIRDRTRKNEAGFPTKFVESFTSGVGIITNDVSDISEFFPIDNSILLKEPNCFSEIKKAIEDSSIRKIEKKDINAFFDFHNYIQPMKIFLEKLFD